MASLHILAIRTWARHVSIKMTDSLISLNNELLQAKLTKQQSGILDPAASQTDDYTTLEVQLYNYN